MTEPNGLIVDLKHNPDQLFKLLREQAASDTADLLRDIRYGYLAAKQAEYLEVALLDMYQEYDSFETQFQEIDARYQEIVTDRQAKAAELDRRDRAIRSGLDDSELPAHLHDSDRRVAELRVQIAHCDQTIERMADEIYTVEGRLTAQKALVDQGERILQTLRTIQSPSTTDHPDLAIWLKQAMTEGEDNG